MTQESNCVFCKILRGEIPSAKVYEDQRVLAFLDIAPFNYGHVVIIPKEHSHSITRTAPEDLGAMMQAAAKIAPAVLRSVRAGGFNLLLNNGQCAGQEVPHVHLHLIPRFVDDPVLLGAPAKKYGEGQMAELAADIQRRVNGGEDALGEESAEQEQ